MEGRPPCRPLSDTMAGKTAKKDLEKLRKTWEGTWEDALKSWSRFTKLARPRWCNTRSDEKKEGLTGSFAMIRLVDHAVVISLKQVHELELGAFGREILAHEIGHHVFTPGDLRDNARLVARIRAGLPSREKYAGIIANLYTDLLINDRLQRSAELNMTGVYEKLAGPGDKLWTLYMRIYEILWRLSPGTLTAPVEDPHLNVDADLGARVIRAYAKDWLGGAGRFAALFLAYLLDVPQPRALVLKLPPWFDAGSAGEGDELPDGLVAIEEEELDGAIHPSEDEALTGISEDAESSKTSARAGGRATRGGKKNTHRSPQAYKELIEGIGVKVNEKDIVIRYYRERALPYLIEFPTREVSEAMDPLPEGVDTWDVGSPVREIDWTESVVRSPHVIPGVTTVKREYGHSQGSSPERVPLDLYVGIDCSGSMSNPSFDLSYPVLAGTVIAMSALRTGARVMACLSGEMPGEYSNTDGFVRSEKEILGILTGYHGTGYAFGLERLRDAFLKGEKPSRPTHILVVSDYDIFMMIEQVRDGWGLIREAVTRAGGGGTFALEIDPAHQKEEIDRMRGCGWDVYPVSSREELVSFARAFSRAKYGQKPGEGRR